MCIRVADLIIAESLSQHDEKHVVPTPFRMENGRTKKKNSFGPRRSNYVTFLSAVADTWITL
jgi:hypothetical protein